MNRLNWDPDKHDKALEASHSATNEKEAAALIQAAYREHGKAVSRNVRTVEQMVEAITALYRAFAVIVKDLPGMKGWLANTKLLLEDKIENVRLTEINQRNLLLEKAIGRKPRKVTFNDLGELVAVPWVAKFCSGPDFVGWALDGNLLVALHESEPPIVVGRLSNWIGVEKQPTLKQVNEAMTKPRRNGK